MKTFDDKILAQIEAYILGEMTLEEQKAFENALAHDPDLREELKLQESIHDSFRDRHNDYDNNDLNNPNVKELIQQLKSEKYQSISTNINNINKQYQKEQNKIIPLKWTKHILISSAVVLILLLCSPFLFKKTNNELVYKEYAIHNPIHLVEKNKTNIISSTIEEQFNKADYKNAYIGLINYLQLNPTNTRAKLALGICALELNNIEEATKIFNEIMIGKSSLRHYGTWYLALLKIKIKKYNESKIFLNNIPKTEYQLYPKAKELLTKF